MKMLDLETRRVWQGGDEASGSRQTGSIYLTSRAAEL